MEISKGIHNGEIGQVEGKKLLIYFSTVDNDYILIYKAPTGKRFKPNDKVEFLVSEKGQKCYIEDYECNKSHIFVNGIRKKP